jgi:hypothetical protein
MAYFLHEFGKQGTLHCIVVYICIGIMALLTKSEFAEMCGMKSNALAVYINPARGEVIVGEGDFIDTSNEVNARFLEKRTAKGKAKGLNIDAPKSMEGIPSYQDSEQLVKYYDALKREKEVEKLKIEIQKKRGEVIPSELIQPLILQHNQSTANAFKIAMERVLTDFIKIKDLNAEEAAQMRGVIIPAINDGIKNATQATLKALQGIINEYSERRGVGERAA